MTVLRTIFAATLAVSALAPLPASAQFFMKSYDFSGAPVRGDEAIIGLDMPDATEAELDAGLVWNLRAALNIAALQCQFAPTLLTVPQYNLMMLDHAAELKSTYATLTNYFKRKNKAPKAAQTALDQFGTRVYGSYSTTSAQLGFCQTASNIGRAAIFAPRGALHTVAKRRLREMRNALVPYGEQRFPRGIGFDDRRVLLPRLDAMCWKKNEWNEKKCGSNVQWVMQ
ncbi:hypothetical protein [Sphingomonas hylomeconis]|uniref:Uncharacterized protein n=1 Tax=Sphingomonas hylomeconis TaxID=1395958 RepID=A0ABV7SYS9_9SPHN|nr:hypothetical protein [Sphingomonas hylomeconis]